MHTPPAPQQQLVLQMVALAIAEDIGPGDITSSIIPVAQRSSAQILTREDCVVCGIPWVEATFAARDPDCRLDWRVSEGQQVQAGTLLCEISGTTRTLLESERIALNFLQTLSGVATCARRYVDAVKDYSSKILDTRKTIPGLRLAQKYAAACGGCHNHRFGLYDAILIKENHILAAGGIGEVVAQLRRARPGVAIEIEVEDLHELEQALEAEVERVLLDNFTTDTLAEAVTMSRGRAETEASGGITLDNIAEVAKTGVDYISVGAITKDIDAIDLSMRIDNTR